MSICHITLPSGVRLDNASEVQQQLQHNLQLQLSDTVDVIEADLAALQQFDSSALAVLLALLRTAKRHNCQWRPLNACQRLTGLAALYGVEDLLFLKASDDL